MKLIEKIRGKLLGKNVIKSEHLQVSNEMIDKFTTNSKFIRNVQSIQVDVSQINLRELKRKLDELEEPTQ